MMTVRIATADDLDALCAIEKHCFSDPWSDTLVEGALHADNYRFLVAEVDGNIAGFAIFLDSFEVELLDIAVLPDYRNAGVGTAILKEFISTCDKDIFLEVRRSNASAIALYEKFGFEEIGVRKNYYSSPTEDALVMISTTNERDK